MLLLILLCDPRAHTGRSNGRRISRFRLHLQDSLGRRLSVRNGKNEDSAPR